MAKPKVQIVISLMDDGQVTVAGPLHDKILAYGLLGVAHEIIATPRAVEPQKLVQPVSAIPSLVRP